MTGRGAHRAVANRGFGGALRSHTFLTLYAAETQSIAGDQLGRVSLAVLVFERTSSASTTALVYALTYLPAIFGGVILGGLGDRVPRRAVMVGCDLIRAALFAVMAIGGIPIAGLMVLVGTAVLFGPVFTSAEVSYLADRLSPEVFRAGMGLRMISGQAAQVGGFAVGGVLVAAVGARGALLVNAATFAVSALLVGLVGFVHRSPRTAQSEDSRAGAGREEPVSLRDLFRRPGLAGLLALSGLAGLFVVPEGLAIPVGADIGADRVRVGLLLAAIPLGSAFGIVLLVRLLGSARRSRAARLMAIACGLPLVPIVVLDHWVVVALCWFASGMLAAYQVEALTALVQATPDRMRSRLVGLGSAFLVGVQGLGLMAAGWFADLTSPAVAIATAGAVGSGAAALIVVTSRRHHVQVATRAVTHAAHVTSLPD